VLSYNLTVKQIAVVSVIPRLRSGKTQTAPQNEIKMSNLRLLFVHLEYASFGPDRRTQLTPESLSTF